MFSCHQIVLLRDVSPRQFLTEETQSCVETFDYVLTYFCCLCIKCLASLQPSETSSPLGFHVLNHAYHQQMVFFLLISSVSGMGTSFCHHIGQIHNYSYLLAYLLAHPADIDLSSGYSSLSGASFVQCFICILVSSISRDYS